MCCVEGTREKVARLLKMYEKSHNFHNFTSGKYVIYTPSINSHDIYVYIVCGMFVL